MNPIKHTAYCFKSGILQKQTTYVVSYDKKCIVIDIDVQNGYPMSLMLGNKIAMGEIDWGDGTKTEVTSATSKVHAYTEFKQYRVVFSGETDYIMIGHTSIIGCKLGELVGVKTIYNLSPPSSMDWNDKFFNNLSPENGGLQDFFKGKAFINNPPSYFISKLTNHSNFFRFFEKYKFYGHIPDSLFANCKQGANFNLAMCEVTLINPDGHKTNRLCYGCLGDNNFSYFLDNAFSNLDKPVSLGDSTFENCTGNNTFVGCFVRAKLKSIGNNTFKGCLNSNFSEAMNGVTIEHLGSGTFENCKNATDFSRVFMYSSNIKTMGEGTFKNCISAENFSEAFLKSGITNVPIDIFADCINANNFSFCFAYASNLVSAPRLWELYPNANGRGCYRDCTSLPWYDEIPSDWK